MQKSLPGSLGAQCTKLSQEFSIESWPFQVAFPAPYQLLSYSAVTPVSSTSQTILWLSCSKVLIFHLKACLCCFLICVYWSPLFITHNIYMGANYSPCWACTYLLSPWCYSDDTLTLCTINLAPVQYLTDNWRVWRDSPPAPSTKI